MKLFEPDLIKPGSILAIGLMATACHVIFNSFYNKLGKNNG